MNRRFSHHFCVDLQTLCNKHRENAIGNSRVRVYCFGHRNHLEKEDIHAPEESPPSPRSSDV